MEISKWMMEIRMNDFDHTKTPATLLAPDIVGLLTRIHEHKGRQELFTGTHKDALDTLVEIAKVQSTGASNAIEGIHTTDKRLQELVRQKAEPRNRTEQKIAGYRDVLATIHEDYAYIHPRPGVILQLHRQLYAFSNTIGGVYKNADNAIVETGIDGKQTVRFQPVPAFLTADALERLCTEFQAAADSGLHDPLLLIPMFVLDFLCIHPFNDGNGRMSRLLTLLLLYRAGYQVGKYISLEKVIEGSKETYYDALQDSSAGWHENANDYAPFCRYLLGTIEKAYGEFEARIALLEPKTKAERIRAYIDGTVGRFTKKDILTALPDISQVTVERALTALVTEGYIEKIGNGRGTGYVRKG
jgi:Fic family protein